MIDSKKIFDRLKGAEKVPQRPFRRQMLSKELLALRASDLATENATTYLYNIRGKKLKSRFKENYQVLNSVYFSLSDIAQHGGFLAAGADWLLDNYHVIDEQVKEIRRDLPTGYYRALPKISKGEWRGYPRVYRIACDYLEHTDSVVQLDTLTGYINAFQGISSLKLSELWAIPIMLRLAIVENIRRLSETLLKSSTQREEVQNLFEKIAPTEDTTAIQILNSLLENLSHNPKLLKRSAPFLARKLRSIGSKSSLGVQWMEEQLKIQQVDLSEIERIQQQDQAADQISVGNSVVSLKSIGRMNWRDWVEDTSVVNSILMQDPSGIFPLSDFYTRDHIRHRLEVLSQRVNKKEEDVAKEVLELCKKNVEQKSCNNDLKTQVGYFLIDEGLPEIENFLKSKPSFVIKTKRAIRSNITFYYLLTYAILTALFSVLTIAALGIPQSYSVFVSLLTFTLLLIPASQLAGELIQWLSGQFVKPKPLPKLEIEDDVSEENRTVVVVQSIIISREHLKTTIEDLEIRAIGNLDKNIRFGILADLADAESEHQSGDRGLITLGCDMISALNEKYLSENGKFFILFRKRQINESQGCYIGWERKRGKISEFNHLLRGHKNTSFSTIEADLDWLTKVKYVITLDNDTRLPPGTAKKLIGCAAHPLNKPIFDKTDHIVERGYGIIQPRVGITLESATSSVFAQTFSGQSGLDPYTMAISDIYQDLFNNASYIGKGIYDVDTFEKALEAQIPENTVLSHDLLESGFTRCGLASDIEVFDDFPQSYQSHSKRQHRWIRGDWQLLPWIFGTTTNRNKPLTNLVKWKLIDNLRRSLVPIYLIALFFIFIATGIGALNWSFVAIIFLGFKCYSLIYQSIFSIPFGYSLSTYFSHQASEAVRTARAVVIEFLTIPHHAAISISAIARTIYRVYFSKKNLLEWQTALSAESSESNSLSSFFKLMGPAILFTIVATIAISFGFSQSLDFVSYLLLLAWCLSPYIAWKISNIKPTEEYELDASESSYLHGIAFDTWKYFRTYLDDKYNYLIPDNLQQIPESVVAERTSPTNISLSLLSVLSAYDLGFLPSTLALEKISKIIETTKKLEKHNGHLLNWYSISDLRPLEPRYVSSVDSGNFVGHLIALREGLRLLPHSPFITKKSFDFLQSGLPNGSSIKNVDQWKFFTDEFNNLIDQSISQTGRSEIIFDFQHLSPFIGWLQNIEILESLSSLGILPRKLEKFNKILDDRKFTPSLNAKMVKRLLLSKDKIPFDSLSSEQKSKIDALYQSLEIAQLKLGEFYRLISKSLDDLDELINETQFEFLFDKSKKLLSIGYNVDSALLDNASYDLLASEARLASFVAVAKGDLPQTHWFVLGRALTDSSGGKALISWSGTMFEYLMPTIVMKDYQSTLLSRTYVSVIKTQRDYAGRRNVPWGISESAYGTVDFENTYQYRAFGVPGLGLKRGLVDDLVISPYSTALSLQIEPAASIANLKKLEQVGARGELGFYEAIDYTEERLVGNERNHVIKSFFAHHQGMSLVAINNILNNSSIINRFHSDQRVKSCELLLQERFPSRIPLLQPHQAEQLVIDDGTGDSKEQHGEHFTNHETTFPRTHLLSNNEYSVLIDHCGSGVSSFKSKLHINRFRDDAIHNAYGQYIYLRDEESGEFWSSTYQPTRIKPEKFEVIFSPHKTEHLIRTRDISSQLETVVSPEDNLEIRKLTLTNHSLKPRKLSATSFFEVCLFDYRGDLAHPAFAKLFVNSIWDQELGYLIFNRKPRTKGDETPTLFHLATSEIVWGKPQYCTDRAKFIGRGRSLKNPEGMALVKNLDLSVGYVLDPCASIRHQIELEPSESTTVYFITGVADSNEEADLLAKKYREIYNLKRTFELAWSYASVELKNQYFTKGSSTDFQRLANAIVYNIPQLRSNNRLFDKLPPQSALWRLGVSGDEPIVLLHLNESEQINIFNELVLAHEYLRNRGIVFDLVVLNEKSGGYLQELQDELESFLRASLSAHLLNQRGGIFIRSSLHVSEEEQNLLEHSARVIFRGDRGTLASQLNFDIAKGHIKSAPENLISEIFQPERFDNVVDEVPNYPIGTFDAETNEFELEIGRYHLPPQPWSNVVANKECGFLITESGTGYTWFGNSRENRITPWSNDPVLDPIYEAIYIRDCQTSEYWSPTLKPIGSKTNVKVKHGFGYSSFDRSYKNIDSNLKVFVDTNDPVKYWLLELTNETKDIKTFEIVFYLEWILGVSKPDSFRTLMTGVNQESGYLFAQNPWGQEFGNQYCVVGSNLPLQDFTTDKTSFVGPFGSMSKPSFFEHLSPEGAVKRPAKTSGSTLSRKTGSGFDSAAILKYEITLHPGEKNEIGFYLHENPSLAEATTKIKKFGSLSHIKNELSQTRKSWQKQVVPFKVETPSKDFDNLVNGWLLYQTLSCRIFARTGFFQSSGALGFRDQLQDSLAFLTTDPEITKNQILLHASRQFEEGDVQHWWHPPSGRGIRSKITDNLLWLPFSVLEYLEANDDISILENEIGFLKGPHLEPHQHDLYFTPEVSDQRASLYDHCCRALDRSLGVGTHGLPFIGAGDWNDGMNEVGPEGKGESVWLGWFLGGILDRFAKLASARQDHERAARYTNHSRTLVTAVENNAWDGEWYRRAYFDDGTPLGSKTRPECKIDSLAQSWAVITNLGDKQKREIALNSAYNELFDKNNQLVRLLWPPLQNQEPSAGYIQSYPPGIRENGGQYTHGSTWLIVALALDNQQDRAFELFNAMNPMTHSGTQGKIEQYKMEPYVTCGDVYSHDQHAGRGGWSWYTGSSGWMYQVAVRYILGFRATAEGLEINPRVPSDWNEFSIEGQVRGTSVKLTARRSDTSEIELNNEKFGSLIPWDKLGDGLNEISVNFI